jgi:putative tryptophan/tyrosine transport system substrate-binding protein
MNALRRRLLAACAGIGLTPVWAQTPAPRRVGVLAPSTAAREGVTLKPFFDEMQRLGWVEGRNVVYDRVFANDQHAQLPRLATELVARGPELIYAPPQPAAVAARRATSKIPIVFATGTDPVGAGLAESLARPGGNATGIGMFDSLAPKSLELLRDILPRARRIGLLGDPSDPRFNLDRNALTPLLPSFGMHLRAVPVNNPTSLEMGAIQLVSEHVDVIFTCSSITFNLRHRLIELTRPQRVPVLGHRGAMADAGALFVYGASLAEQIRRSAMVVDKVLKGARPGEIPIEQPTRLELVVNQKTARALGITIPQSVLVRADRVIE